MHEFLKSFYKKHLEIVLAVAIYTACYVFYALVFHVSFDATPLAYYMQYLDPDLLEHDLLRSLYYMHSQPPLLNLIAGIALKINSSKVDVPLAGAYFVMGAVAIAYFSKGLLLLGLRRNVRFGLYALLCIYPTFIFYTNWIYAAHVEFCLCCALFYYVMKVLQMPSLTWRAGVELGVPFMLLAYIRPQWHLIFFILMVMIIKSRR